MRFESSFSRLSILRRIIANNHSSSSRCAPAVRQGAGHSAYSASTCLFGGSTSAASAKRSSASASPASATRWTSRPDSHDIALRKAVLPEVDADTAASAGHQPEHIEIVAVGISDRLSRRPGSDLLDEYPEIGTLGRLVQGDGGGFRIHSASSMVPPVSSRNRKAARNSMPSTATKVPMHPHRWSSPGSGSGQQGDDEPHQRREDHAQKKRPAEADAPAGCR